MARSKKQKKIKFILTVICLIILAVLWFVIKPMLEPTYEVPSGTAEFHFIDVGQGDAVLIKEGNINILVDTGDKDAKDELLDYLDNHGVTVIDYFVVTHFDADHFANAVDVLEKYDVKKLLIPDQVKDTKMYESFIEKAEEQADAGLIEVLNANEMVGENLLSDPLEIKILAPLKDDYDDSNNYSVVLMARYGNKRVLLTGDAEKEAEEDLVERYMSSDLDCDVYKLGHHGSRTSSSQELLNKATPSIVVASCGTDNKYGHPHTETWERVKNLERYRTDEQGTIIISIANDEIAVKTEK